MCWKVNDVRCFCKAGCCTHPLELIGEEIYDEFDKQGAHGQPYGVPPIYIQEMKEDKASAALNVSSVTRPESREGSQGKITGLKTLGFFRTRSAPPVARAKEEISNMERTSDGDATATDGKMEADGGLTILMPRPVPGTLGDNPPSIILEQNSSISSTDTGVSGTLVGVENSAASRLLTVPNPIPETSQLTSGSKSSTSHHSNPSPPIVTSPVPTLEAILLDRKRRLAVHAAASGSGSNAANSPGSYPPILYKDFAFSSTVASTPSPSDSLKSVVGTVGKGTKFKSSPLGGGNRTGDVVAERVGAAYSPSLRQSEDLKGADNWKESEDLEKAM